MEEKKEMDEKLRYIVKRGKNAGIVLTPHLYEDGYFVHTRPTPEMIQSGKKENA